MANSFNPADSSTRAGWYNGGQLPAVWEFYRTRPSINWSPTIANLESGTINPGGVQSEPGFDGFALENGAQEVALSPIDHFLFLAAAQQSFDVSDVTPAVSRLFRLAPSGATPVDSQFLQLQTNLANGLTQWLPKVGLSELSLSFSAGEPVVLNVTGQAEEFTRFMEPIRTVGTLTPEPVLRGLPSFAQTELVDGDVYILVDSVGGLPTTIDIKAKIGLATPYGGPSTVITLGEDTWTDLLDETGAKIGDVGSYVQINLSSLTGSTATDEFRFVRDGNDPVISLPLPVIEFGRVNAFIEIAGEEECVQSGTLTITRPLQKNACYQGAFDRGALSYAGDTVVTWEFERQHIDVRYIRLMEGREPFAVRVDLDSGIPIVGGLSGETYSISIRSELVRFDGEQVSVTAADSFPETISGTAYLSSDPTYPSPVTFDVITDRTDISTP